MFLLGDPALRARFPDGESRRACGRGLCSSPRQAPWICRSCCKIWFPALRDLHQPAHHRRVPTTVPTVPTCVHPCLALTVGLGELRQPPTPRPNPKEKCPNQLLLHISIHASLPERNLAQHHSMPASGNSTHYLLCMYVSESNASAQP